MNPDYCATRPAIDPDTVEWAFPRGVFQLVAAVPDEAEGDVTVIRLDGLSDLDILKARDRTLVRALLDIAHDRLDATEPTNANGIVR